MLLGLALYDESSKQLTADTPPVELNHLTAVVAVLCAMTGRQIDRCFFTAAPDSACVWSRDWRTIPMILLYEPTSILAWFTAYLEGSQYAPSTAAQSAVVALEVCAAADLVVRVGRGRGTLAY